MKKHIALLTLILAFCISLSALTVTGATAQKESENANALFLPSSYEQYLELNEPSDFAVSDKYIAVADKLSPQEAALYLYDKAQKQYRSYKFTTNNTISSLNFYTYEQTDYLFFLETGNIVNYIALDDFDLHVRLDNFSASTMIIDESEIYYTIQTGASCNAYYAVLNGLQPTGESQINRDFPLPTNTIPSFSLFNGQVYFSSDKVIYLCTPETLTEKYSTSDSVNYFAIYGESNYNLLYSNAGGLLYHGNATASFSSDKNATVIKYYDNLFYILIQHGIIQYDLKNERFTDYEIGKYSSSTNRLNNASDVSVYSDKLVIADRGNSRVSLYDGNGYGKPVIPATVPELVCAGEESFLVTSGSKIYIYPYTQPNSPVERETNGAVAAVTYTSGCYFLLSDNGKYSYKLDGNSGAVLQEGTPNIANVKSIAGDIHGNIYVLTQAGQVDSYTHDNFLATETSTSEKVTELNAGCKKLLVDYEGNLYGLTDDCIYRYSPASGRSNTPEKFELDFSDYVFSEEKKAAVSFAFGLTKESVWILSDGFMIQTSLNVATLEKIEADGIYETMRTGSASADGMLVNVKEGSVAVKIDAAGLQSDTVYLPYLSFTRLSENKTGVILGQTQNGSYVVAFYDYFKAETPGSMPKHEYTVCLIPKDNNRENQTENHYLTNIVNIIVNSGDSPYYTESAEEFKGFISSDVHLYSRPLMRSFTQIDEIERTTQVSVLGKFSYNKFDSEYYLLRLANGSCGYVPAGFITQVNVNALENEKFSYRHLKKGKSATLTAQDGTGTTITLEDKERLKVYDQEASQKGFCVVSYEKGGIVYIGEVASSYLYKATPAVLVTLFIILLVTAAVLLSMCYLLLRKKPTLN